MDLEELVREVSPPLLRYAYLLTGRRSVAEDLVQTVLIKACLRWERISHLDSPVAYLKKMVLNAFLDLQRRRSSHEQPFDPADQPADPMFAAVDDVAADVVARDHVWRAPATLAPRQRAVLVLRFYEDLDDASIATALGITASTVRSTASRATERLRASLLDPTSSDHPRR